MAEHPFEKSGLGRSMIRILGSVMESPLRYHFWGPEKILTGADLWPGQTVLELGCGTGYFTVPAARLIGNQGSLVAMDILPEAVELVAGKVYAAGLVNVRVVEGDALNTGLEAGSFDLVLLFGVIPAPMIPVPKLILELHRVLKETGTLAVWPPVPGWLPQAILQTGLFTLAGKRIGVQNFRSR